MVDGKKLAVEVPLPSVLEDDDAETEKSERLQLGEVGSSPHNMPSLQTLKNKKGSVNSRYRQNLHPYPHHR